MMRARLVWTVMIVVGLTAWATAFACKDKTTAASASSANCPATASCPANSAQCAHAKGTAAAAAAAECPYHSSAAVTADAEGGCSHHTASATTASMSGCSAHAKGAMATDAGCSAHAKAAMAAAGASGCSHDKATSAGMSGCSHGAEAMSAAAAGCMHGSAAAASMGCSGHSASAHADMDCASCVSCADMANCEKELESVGAVIQVVRLKNGVMYVYTADGANKVRTVQAALAHRGDQWNKVVAAANEKLCTPCREMRGAAASGKLNRETVNIEGGCLTLMTSNDPGVVKRIYAMAGIGNGARAKS